MEKLSRNNRVVAITKILMETPNKIIGLNRFSEFLNAAKSTISEDIVIVREVLEKLEKQLQELLEELNIFLPWDKRQKKILQMSYVKPY